MQKIEGKWSHRMTQNMDIQLQNCFVPDKNKLTYCRDFHSGTNAILESSRVCVAWGAAGLAAGAYENALRYCLQRKQFGRSIAKFQLVQERLSRMLANCEFSLALLLHLSKLMEEGKSTPG